MNKMVLYKALPQNTHHHMMFIGKTYWNSWLVDERNRQGQSSFERIAIAWAPTENDFILVVTMCMAMYWYFWISLLSLETYLLQKLAVEITCFVACIKCLHSNTKLYDIVFLNRQFDIHYLIYIMAWTPPQKKKKKKKNRCFLFIIAWYMQSSTMQFKTVNSRDCPSYVPCIFNDRRHSYDVTFTLKRNVNLTKSMPIWNEGETAKGSRKVTFLSFNALYFLIKLGPPKLHFNQCSRAFSIPVKIPIGL